MQISQVIQLIYNFITDEHCLTWKAKLLRQYRPEPVKTKRLWQTSGKIPPPEQAHMHVRLCAKLVKLIIIKL